MRILRKSRVARGSTHTPKMFSQNARYIEYSVLIDRFFSSMSIKFIFKSFTTIKQDEHLSRCFGNIDSQVHIFNSF